MLRARESSHDIKASIDLLVDKLERQARRLRDKRQRGLAKNEEAAFRARAASREPGEPVLVKTKQFPVKPMSAEEAVLQLELIGHDFFVFQNAETSDVNVLYRRRDGNYGLIEPQVP